MTTRPARLLALALMLGACAVPNAGGVPATTGAGDAAACRVGPNGAPPARAGTADRGIGGTGAPRSPARMADRGIGGTGIVGVITGFGSICVDGQEVALSSATAVRVDGERASGASLRAGQVAAIDAASSGAALAAREIAVRHEVSGPVEAVEPDGALRIAGQRVVVSTQTWGEATPRLTDWVVVSGLRELSGEVAATRLDPIPPGGTVTVHGLLTRTGGTVRIGALPIQSGPGMLDALLGQYVTASGRYRKGRLLAASVTADVLAEDPAAYFGTAVRVLVLEAYATASGGHVHLGPALDVAAAPDLGPVPASLTVVELTERADGSLLAVRITRASGGSGVSHGLSPVAPGPR